MKTLIINGYKVQIFNHFNGTQLFIFDAENTQIYGHKVSGNPVKRAEEIISQQ